MSTPSARRLVQELSTKSNRAVVEQDNTFFTKLTDVDWLGNLPIPDGAFPDGVEDITKLELHLRYTVEVDYRSYGIKDIDYFLRQAIVYAEGVEIARITPDGWEVRFDLEGYSPFSAEIDWNAKRIHFS